MSIEEIEKKRAARREALAAARAEQEEIDQAKLFDLEEEHGEASLVVAEVSAWKPGMPTIVVMRVPNGPEFKRYQDMVKGRGDKPGDPTAAANMLGAACRLYPDADAYKTILDVSPGIHINAAVAAINRAAGKVQERAKS